MHLWEKYQHTQIWRCPDKTDGILGHFSSYIAQITIRLAAWPNCNQTWVVAGMRSRTTVKNVAQSSGGRWVNNVKCRMNIEHCLVVFYLLVGACLFNCFLLWVWKTGQVCKITAAWGHDAKAKQDFCLIRVQVDARTQISNAEITRMMLQPRKV